METRLLSGKEKILGAGISKEDYTDIFLDIISLKKISIVNTFDYKIIRDFIFIIFEENYSFR